jgi:zinc protease
VAAQTSTPDFAFASALTSALTQDHPRARPITTATVDAMDLDRSIDFYRERFANAGDFTFIFAGSFEVDEMRPLVERYLASLPALAQTESWRDPGIRAPAGVVERRVARGTDPKSRTAIAFAGPHAPEPSRGLALRAAGEVLQTRLLSVLREELGGTYTVSVGANVTRIPADEYRVTVMFGSDPARADALAARVFEEVARLTAAGPTAGEVANVKTAMARDLETRSRQNAFLLSQLADSYRTGDPPEALLETPRLIASLDAAAVHAAARAALDVTRYVRVTLGPEPQR